MKYEFSKINFFRYSIARSFISYVLLIGVLVTVLGTGITIYNSHNERLRAFVERLVSFQRGQIPILADLIVQQDLNLLEKELNGLLAFPMIEAIEVTNNDGISMQVQNNDFVLDESYTEQIKGRYQPHFINSVKLTQEVNGQVKSVGKFSITTNLETLEHNFTIQGYSILIAQVIESIIISIGGFYLFFFFVGRHLIIIARYANSLKLGHLDAPMEVMRPITEKNKNDEISRLNEAMATMRLNLLGSYQKSQTAEKDREELITSLQDKNAELERFTYTVSHDLKSPLVTINGFIGLLEKDIKSENQENIYKDIQIIKSAAKTMHLLLNDLLELSQIGVKKGVRIETSFNPIIDGVIETLSEQIKSRIARIDVEKNLPQVRIEEVRFKEVFLNLIENALKYMENQPEPNIQIGTTVVTNKGGEAETAFFVKDNGRGINSAYCEKIFELFERVAVDIDGTGVGLAIVKRVIETHNGRIWVESEGIGKGSTFYFVIPLI